MSRKIIFLLILLLLGSALSACSSGGDNAAAQTVENYLAALADKNDALLVSYICPDYEFNALLEFDAFSMVQTSLKDVSCQEVNRQDGQADVVCQGSIEATYGNELRTLDLSRRTYHLLEQDGSWLVCGYDDAN